jgi:ABC-type Fe3+-siderophore transport system permease subunit
MLGFLGSSLVALTLALSDPNSVSSAMYWLLGDLSRARLAGAAGALVGSVVLSFLIWTRWRELDALLTGEESAMAIGVSVTQARRRIVVLSSLLIGLCVAGAGMIGFIGLVIPHFVRRFSGSLHLTLLPLCALWGAAALTFSDAVGRAVLRSGELPVGVVTALIGAPIFLWVITQRRTHG